MTSQAICADFVKVSNFTKLKNFTIALSVLTLNSLGGAESARDLYNCMQLLND